MIRHNTSRAVIEFDTCAIEWWTLITCKLVRGVVDALMFQCSSIKNTVIYKTALNPYYVIDLYRLSYFLLIVAKIFWLGLCWEMPGRNLGSFYRENIHVLIKPCVSPLIHCLFCILHYVFLPFSYIQVSETAWTSVQYVHIMSWINCSYKVHLNILNLNQINPYITA